MHLCNVCVKITPKPGVAITAARAFPILFLQSVDYRWCWITQIKGSCNLKYLQQEMQLPNVNKQGFPRVHCLSAPGKYFSTKILFLALYLSDTISLIQIVTESLWKFTFRLYAVTELVFGEPSHKNLVCTLGVQFIGEFKQVFVWLGSSFCSDF